MACPLQNLSSSPLFIVFCEGRGDEAFAGLFRKDEFVMSKSRVSAARKSHKASRRNSYKNGSRRLFVEGLEHRQVLAGDVLATMIGGNLMIRGDAADNGLHLTMQTDGSIEVSGVEAGGSATTINGSAEPFVANNVRHLTRINLGAGDDALTIDTQVDTDTTASGSSSDTSSSATNDPISSATPGNSGDTSTTDNSGPGNMSDHSGGFMSRLGRLNALRNISDRFLGSDFTDRIGSFLNNVLQRQQMIINTGPGSDTVDAEVSSNVRVHLAGNSAGDDISIHTLDDADPSMDGSAMSGASSAGASLGTGSNANADGGVSGMASRLAAVSANGAASVDGSGNLTALDNVLANLDSNLASNVAANFGLGRGTSSDLDSALTSSLLFNPALNSASNIGPSALLNTDQNLNGSIGGAAAQNLIGDQSFDDIGLFNRVGLPNLSTTDAATLALMSANSFNMNANAVDDFFDDLAAQNQSDLNSTLNSQAGLASNFGFNDSLGNGALNSNINSSLSGNFQSPLATLPMG
jgi:hypothetical protein